MVRLVKWLWSALTMAPVWSLAPDHAITRDGVVMAWAVKTEDGSWRFAGPTGDVFNIPFRSEREVFEYARGGQ